MNAYYDGTKLLSLLTLSGKKPEIYICNTNRSSGKTTFFNRMCVKKFINNKSKFGILYRYNNELNGVSEKFFPYGGIYRAVYWGCKSRVSS